MLRAICGGRAAANLAANDGGAPGLRPSPSPKPSPWLGLGRICRLRLLSESKLSRRSSSGATPAANPGASRGVNLPASRTGIRARAGPW
jgi:hypothetical protein